MLHSFNIKVMPNMVIHYENGHTQLVTINFCNDGRTYIGNGWHAFINENNVEVGDMCVFEFILGEKSICNELHVQILRGNARTENPSQHWPWKKEA